MDSITHAQSSETAQQQPGMQKCLELSNVPAYGSGAYWSRRYAANERNSRVDWLCTFRQVQERLSILIKPKANVLIVGCGASSFGTDIEEEMNVTCVTFLDQAEELMVGMSRYYARLNRFKIIVDDYAAGLPNTPTASYDCVIDKASLDTIACSGLDTIPRMKRSIRAAARVLKNDGVFVVISSAPPETRVPYLEVSFGCVVAHEVDEDFGVYLYACKDPMLGIRAAG